MALAIMYAQGITDEPCQVKVVTRSVYNKKERETILSCSPESLQAGCVQEAKGEPMDSAFPFLNTEERELIKTGSLPEDFREEPWFQILRSK